MQVAAPDLDVRRQSLNHFSRAVLDAVDQEVGLVIDEVGSINEEDVAAVEEQERVDVGSRCNVAVLEQVSHGLRPQGGPHRELLTFSFIRRDL